MSLKETHVSKIFTLACGACLLEESFSYLHIGLWTSLVEKWKEIHGECLG